MISENEEELDAEEVEEEIDPEKEAKIEKEKKELLNRVLSGNITNSKEKVAYILNRFSASRNSDIELAWNYWLTFEKEKFNGHSVNKRELFNLTRIPSLVRTRAKIQNEYKLFQADDEVRKHRGVLAKEKKEEAIEDRPPDLPVYSVFIDESGKNSDYLSVGGLWVIDGGFKLIETQLELSEWKKFNSIDFEFHFTKARRQKVQLYKDFFLKFLSLNPTVGFKVIMVKNTGFPDEHKALVDLTFHLINKGVEHENSSGRAPLPRILRVWLDDEEEGQDKLKLENIKERLISQKNDDLYLGEFEALSSDKNFYIQAVDLFTASVNRKLHHPNGDHFKDELANYILDLVNFDYSQFDKTNSNIDNSTVFNLSKNK